MGIGILFWFVVLVCEGLTLKKRKLWGWYWKSGNWVLR